MADALTLLEGGTSLTTRVGSTVTTVGDTLFLTLMIALIIIVLGGLAWFVWWTKSFKYIIKINEVVNRTSDEKGNYVVCHDRAKRVKKMGVEYWKLKRRRAFVAAPPSDALQITNRGRFYAECFHWEKSGIDSGYKWVTPNVDISGEELRESFTLSMLQEERALLSDRIRRANDRQSRSLWDYAFQIAGMTLVVIIVVSLLAFYGEITKNVKETSAAVDVTLVKASNILAEQVYFQQELTRTYQAVTGQKIANLSSTLPLMAQVGGGS